MLMGIIRLPNFDLYWSTRKLIQFDSIRNIMSKGKFFYINKFFRTYDIHNFEKNKKNNTDKFTKIRTFLEIIKK